MSRFTDDFTLTAMPNLMYEFGDEVVYTFRVGGSRTIQAFRSRESELEFDQRTMQLIETETIQWTFYNDAVIGIKPEEPQIGDFLTISFRPDAGGTTKKWDFVRVKDSANTAFTVVEFRSDSIVRHGYHAAGAR